MTNLFFIVYFPGSNMQFESKVSFSAEVIDKEIWYFHRKMEEDRNSYMCSPATMSTFNDSSRQISSNFDESSTEMTLNFDERSTQMTSGDDVSVNFIESGGARPKIFANIIDDSPLQNQIQRNKECKIEVIVKTFQRLDNKVGTSQTHL